MKLIVGLGNIGAEYDETRHNIGFMFLDYLSSRLNLDGFSLVNKFFAEVTYANINSEKIIFAKPITFMNKSGISISKIASYYKIDVSDICVIYDDVSMDFGKIRFRETGSAGGHNGIKSALSHIQDGFARIKIGVGNDSQYDLSDWVLSKFSDSEIIDLESEVFKKSSELLNEKFLDV